MALIDIHAIETAEYRTEPFDFLVATRLFSEQTLDALCEDYPDIDAPANHRLQGLRYGATFQALIDELHAPSFTAVLGDKFDMDLSDLPTTVTVRKYCERSDGNIHTDHKSKVLTALIYFNPEWRSPDGQLRLLRSKRDIEDYVVQVPPLGGTLIAFRRTDSSWHGHTRYVGERRIMQLNYLKKNRLAIAAQQCSRYGTHLMKNVLGVR